jgi:hypothetical protein
MSKADKLRESGAATSKSDQLRLWAIDFLEQINTAVGGGGGGGGLALESTQLSVLNAIITSQKDVEILLVSDIGNGGLVVQQITDYSGGGAPVVTYKTANGTDYSPVGPLEYLDPSAIQNLILAELITMATPVANTATSILLVVAPGDANVTAGKRSISFMNTGDLDCEVDGVVLKAGLSITYPLLSDRDTYDTIPYNA